MLLGRLLGPFTQGLCLLPERQQGQGMCGEVQRPGGGAKGVCGEI